jgi:GNAT superfamily N-acetyltransferase
MMTQLKTCSKEHMELILSGQPEGKNTRFLNAAHSLWFRFHNYEKNPPFYITDEEGCEIAFVFATYSERTKYMNLYEIVTVEGAEGKGYASKIWDAVVKDAYDKGMRRLKISCTPSSVTWHNRNGLVFWAVDPSGSLRSDQPLYPTREKQLEFRSMAIEEPRIAFPSDQKVVDQLLRESLQSHGFGKKKTEKVQEAIHAVGDSWLRPELVDRHAKATLDEFFT